MPNPVVSFDEQAVKSGLCEPVGKTIEKTDRLVCTVPDGKSALMLVAARLKYIADSEWGLRRYLDASFLKEQSC